MRKVALAGFALAAVIPGQSPAVPIGSAVSASFTDLRWQSRSLRELPPRAATVVFFATIDCPLVQRYLPRIGRAAREYADRGVVFVVANVGLDDPFVDAAGQVAEIAPAAVFAKDYELSLADACGVDRTAAAVVLDRDGRLVYRGRVDDQHGYAGARPQPRRHDLLRAIDDALAQREVAVATTEISGCRITRPSDDAPAIPPNYARDVAPILRRHCASCHRPDGEAPFALQTERQAKRHAAMMVEVVEQGRMPPWYASTAYGEFSNRPTMTDAERELLRRWWRAGMPSGATAVSDADTTSATEPRGQPGWRIGEPDLVLSLKAPVRLPADGVLAYKYFALPFQFRQDTWVEAIEIRPDNERVLHHCNLAHVKFGERFSQRNFITGHVPGGDAMVLDPGTAVRIPAGSALALQAHYVTTGRRETDRLRVGLRFPRVKVQRELRVTIVGNLRFEIPAGALAHPVKASRKLPVDGIGIGLVAHMHLRGRDMKVTATAPNGDRETLLLVPNYNFDWQQSYRWARNSRSFAAGTQIAALAHFDNSSWNPFNPDPDTSVEFGLQTTDEMMYAFLFWLARDEALDLTIDPTTGHVLADDR